MCVQRQLQVEATVRKAKAVSANVVQWDGNVAAAPATPLECGHVNHLNHIVSL